MSKLVSLMLLVSIGSSFYSSDLYAQADTTLPALLAGRLHWDSRVHRLAVARELLTIYSKLDSALPNTSSHEFHALTVKRPASKKYDAQTEKQIEDARYAVNGINNSLLYIVDSSHHSLRREMISWVGVCISLLDDNAFRCISKLSSKGTISVPRVLASSKSMPPGSQSTRYARAILEHFVGVYVFSVNAPE